MSIDDRRPVCPKCGTSARVVVVRKAHVRCTLNVDGTLGSVLSIARGPNEIVSYECGGGHVFGGDNMPAKAKLLR